MSLFVVAPRGQTLALADVARAAGCAECDVVLSRQGRCATFDGPSGVASLCVAGRSHHVFRTAAVSAAATSAATRRKLLSDARVFVVGAGGIGCELLKNLVLAGATRISVIDLDTIDSTNLNRQFLFRGEHVGEPKSTTAAAVVGAWRPDGVEIRTYHGNIKEPEYDTDFFAGFDVVINGLDNVSARKHVNRMCMQARVPLVESGTMGYNGQVQPILRDACECYDCRPKATEQKTFAVCTIHARPTSMVHCVHYAKELYSRFFGDEAAAAAAAEDDGEATPAAATEFDFINHIIADAKAGSVGDGAAARSVATALFTTKIQDMLSMKTEWTITPPVPLTAADTVEASVPDALRVPSVPETYALFRRAFEQCLRRGCCSFSKDDSMAVDFVAAVANLRAHNFHIAAQSVHDVKTIAGNIVPAIASTNATIAACAVDAAIGLVAAKAEGRTDYVPQFVALRHVAQQRRRRIVVNGVKERVSDACLLHGFACERPNPKCLVCSANQHEAHVACNAGAHTLGSFVKGFLLREMSLVAPTINAGASTLYEHEDFEDLVSRPLTTWLPVSRGASVIWTVGDLYQALEWTVTITHDGALDETAFNTDVNVQAAVAAAAAASAAATDDATGDAAVVEDDAEAVVAYTKNIKRHRAEVAEAVEIIDDE